MRTTDEKEAKLEDEMMKIKTPASVLFADLQKHKNTYAWVSRHFVSLFFQRQMINRLLIVDYIRKNYKALQSVKIEKPVFVIGVPRTGTTFTLNLLAADPNNRFMPLWQGFGPTLPEKEVRKQCTVQLGFLNKMMPHLKAVHNIDLEEPEEDMVLLDYTFCCAINCILLDLPAYREYLLGENVPWEASYRFHKYCLQILQHRYPGHRVEDGKELKEEKQWMLKAPVHLGFLGPLLAIYPDARIVWCHRDLTQATVSMMSLMQHFRSVYIEQLDLKDVGEDSVRMIKYIVDEGMKFREKRPEIFFDLFYDDLMKDPLGSCKKIYDHFGLRWTKETEEGIGKCVREMPQGKHGSHKYTPETYSYSTEELDEIFAEYHSRFPVQKKKKPSVTSPWSPSPFSPVS